MTVSDRSPDPSPAAAPVFGSPAARVSEPTMRMLSLLPPLSSTLPTDTRWICRNLMSAYSNPARISSTGSRLQTSSTHFSLGRRSFGQRGDLLGAGTPTGDRVAGGGAGGGAEGEPGGATRGGGAPAPCRSSGTPT